MDDIATQPLKKRRKVMSRTKVTSNEINHTSTDKTNNSNYSITDNNATNRKVKQQNCLKKEYVLLYLYIFYLFSAMHFS